MGDLFQQNLALLKKHQPHVYDKLNLYMEKRYKPSDNSVERILLAHYDDIIINMLVICKKGQFVVCDSDDPISEAYAWIDKYIDPSNKADIIFGLGFGFHLEVLLTSFENKKVLIIEPNMELFVQILKVRNLEQIIKKAEILLDEGIDTVLNRINALFWDTGKGGIQLEPFEVYGEIFPETWDELRGRFIKHAENFNVDIATRRFFGDLWIRNYIQNADRLAGASNAYGLAGKFRGVPGILVSAGPSLSKNMHLLKGLEDKAVIMAAGTAVNLLEDNGIEPHFMVAIDASDEEAEIHRKVKSSKINFIYSNQVATGSLDSYPGPRFFMNYTVDAYSSEFMKFAGVEAGMFISGPSVANTCFDLLFKMGCNPIILVGQDLAYTGGSNYAGEEAGSVLDKVKDYEAEGYIKTQDIYGKDVYTKLPFLTMRNWFEGYFEAVSDKVEIINATEGGLNIEHSRNEKLSDILGNITTSSIDVKGTIKGVYEKCRFPEAITEKLSEYKRSILSEIEKLEKEKNEQLKIADHLRRDIYHPGKDKKAFDKLVRRIGELADHVIKSPIYETILRNLIEIEFFLIKLELERGVRGLTDYRDIKGMYIEAIERQCGILQEKLDKVKALL